MTFEEIAIISGYLLFMCGLVFCIKGFQFYKQYVDCQVDLKSVEPARINTTSPTKKKHLVIIGASFAGLTTAACLSKEFEKVTVIEANQYEEGESIVRSRQGNQPHVISYRSMEVWDRLFPGFVGGWVNLLFQKTFGNTSINNLIQLSDKSRE